MNRPLVITDCDEVLMHMVVPFAEWVDSEHGVIFRIEDASFANALKRKECGTPLEAAEVWPLLDGFFRTEMGRQTPIPGALDAMAAIAEHADIVVLTNVGPDHQQTRADQLAALGLAAPVIGIGASPAAQGQILVSEDILGLYGEFTPKFVKRYAEIGNQISEAAASYAADVRARRFPAMEHCFLPKSGGQSRP